MFWLGGVFYLSDDFNCVFEKLRFMYLMMYFPEEHDNFGFVVLIQNLNAIEMLHISCHCLAPSATPLIHNCLNNILI